MNLVTKQDLQNFKQELLNELKHFVKNNNLQVVRDDNQREWLRSKAIRNIMQISPATLQNLRVSGKIRYKKVMGSYFYNNSDLKELFKITPDE